MGGLHRRPEGPKGNLFMTGGAGRRAQAIAAKVGTGFASAIAKRGEPTRPERNGLLSSADLVQDCSRRKPDGYRVRFEGSRDPAAISLPHRPPMLPADP
ncbi:hypothetical protein CP97_14666 [Aurantiacibacter atlanticus]|uniref:Uncharacterized protein n=1 Tax=Aurantiacibacter atlanticus TaxID=1648404 RepID=A0A161I9U4_9SPHN|nr:hypothetical protein CP97_14666 [Aurantiacibacter atlanticus]